MRALTALVCSFALGACGATTAETAATEIDSPPSAGWAANLEELLPAIDRCLVDTPNTRWISFAGEQRGATLVRLSGSEQNVDCRVSARSGPGGTTAFVIDIRPRDETLVVEGENQAIFVRAPGQNPGGECYTAPEVRSTTGELLGWMTDPEGC